MRFRAAPESISAVKSIKVISVDSQTGKVIDLVGRRDNCSTLTWVVILVFFWALCGYAVVACFTTVVAQIELTSSSSLLFSESRETQLHGLLARH